MKATLASSRFVRGAAGIWAAGAGARAWLYKRGVRKRKRLRAKVISIGNIAWGGAGKTPFTIWLAGRLQTGGLRVSILTRGYGRASKGMRILPPGTDPDEARNDGDEVQLYLRRLTDIPIGIAASRHEAGHRVEEQYPVDVHLLDDGFQHLRLARDVDLVLVDASRPWGSRQPGLKLLREPLGALRRAHAIVLTRGELADSEGLQRLQTALRTANPLAQLFSVRTRLTQFLSRDGGFSCDITEMRTQRAVAFCGLGNPENFFSTLETAGMSLAGRQVFRDHHRHSTEDVRGIERLAQEKGADCLVTTEKDLVNLPRDYALVPPLYWAVIEPVVDDEEQFLEWIQQQLGLPAGRQPKPREVRRHQGAPATG